MGPKTVYLACAAEEDAARRLFVAQWARAGAQARFLHALGQEPGTPDWKRHVQEEIRAADGVIALIGGYTPTSDGSLWPIRCAVAEGKPLLGLWLETDHRVQPPGLDPARCRGWTWESIGQFLDGL